MHPMVTTNKNLTRGIHKLERKELKHTAKENHQTTKEERKRRGNEQRRTTQN